MDTELLVKVVLFIYLLNFGSLIGVKTLKGLNSLVTEHQCASHIVGLVASVIITGELTNRNPITTGVAAYALFVASSKLNTLWTLFMLLILFLCHVYLREGAIRLKLSNRDASLTNEIRAHMNSEWRNGAYFTVCVVSIFALAGVLMHTYKKGCQFGPDFSFHHCLLL